MFIAMILSSVAMASDAVPVAPAPAPTPVMLPEPPTGTAELWTSAILGSVSLVSISIAPYCYEIDPYEFSQADMDSCFMTYAAIAAGGVAFGVPLAVIGFNRRARHDDWELHMYATPQVNGGITTGITVQF